MVTCGPQLEVALAGPSLRGVSVTRLVGVSRRSTLLLAAVDLLFEDAGIGRDRLDRVVVSRGPGSFTGIRSGLASAGGLAAATGAEILAYDSLLCQAARLNMKGAVWAAQPGRRGEVYGVPFDVVPDRPPSATDELRIVAVADAAAVGPWVAAEALDLGDATRAVPVRTAAEALLELAAMGVASQAAEPLYVEGPPIHRRDAGGG
jgi:tRNA threonylcarbamoyl adenosine modification protein YeaZ